CISRELNDSEKKQRDDGKFQRGRVDINKNESVLNNNVNEWQTINNMRNMRNENLNGSFNAGRNYVGESSKRGRFGMRGRGGRNGMNGREQTIRGKTKMDVDVEGIDTSGVGHGISSRKMFSELSDETQIEEKLNLEAVRARIDVICSNNLFVSNEEKNSWPEDLKEYFKKKSQDIVQSMDAEKVGEVAFEKLLEQIKLDCECSMDDEVAQDQSGIDGDLNQMQGDFMRKNGISLCGIIETQLKKKFVKKVCDDVFGSWSWASNSIDSSKGCRIVVGWDTSAMTIQLLQQTNQITHFLVRYFKDNRQMYVSMVYGENSLRARLKLWSDLIEINATEFVECVDKFEMEDINMSEMFYTWIQRRRNLELGILKKLEKIMGNNSFIYMFPASFVHFMPYLSSDHCSAVLCMPDVTVQKRRSFRFMNFLTEKSGFKEVVKNNLNIDVEGYAMFKLIKRSKSMKKNLRRLNRQNRNVFEKVNFLQTELARVQECLDKDPSNSILREEEMIYANAYKEAAIDEERLLKQKTKIEWLQYGDSNSSYFHNVIEGRISRSRIEVVYDESGNKYCGDSVANQFVSHFSNFLGTCDEVFDIDNADNLFTKKLDADSSLEMIKPVTDDEIKEAIFSIDDNKASGPDGYTSKFFKASWSVVGPDVCCAVKEFFVTVKMLGELNATLISLIPKVSTPAKVTDYRPITCCNVVYKTISKVITNRFKFVLDDLVEANQSAFIPGMLISDNVLLAQEFMKGYNWDIGVRNCAFKGDPISPYLFTLVMKVLNLMIKRQIRRDRRFKFHSGCQKLKISSLYFADDLLMLCHGDMISSSILRRGLDEFSMSSGLYPSMSQSNAFFCNIPSNVKDEIKLVMPFSEGVLPIRYLGVPLVAKRITNVGNYLIENNNWCWPIDWMTEYDTVIDVPVPTLNNDVEDRSVWFNKKGKGKRSC
ncbi:RNA-directed DNA polymerase, eukaryota, reverse transcriptase zinc-binding domain protein, partial [Tanacetum coccineum]